MPNYIVTVNSKFQPYTYEQLIAPLKEYGQAYAAQEAAASDLESKANAVEARLNPDLDSQAYAVMKAYTDKIKDYANTLSREGLSMQTRKDIIRHKNAFESEVGPVQNAIKWKDEQMKKWQDYSLQNPSAFANFNPATTSVDYYMQHPSATFNSLVGDKLTDEAAKFYTNFQRNLRDKGQENTWKRIIGGTYYQQRHDSGYTPEELQYIRDQVMYDIQNGTVDASKLREDYQYLYQGLVDMYNRTGVDSWKNLNGEDDITSRNKALDYLATGLAWAINGSTFKELSNPYAVPRSGSGDEEDVNLARVTTSPSDTSDYSNKKLSGAGYTLTQDGYVTTKDIQKAKDRYAVYASSPTETNNAILNINNAIQNIKSGYAKAGDVLHSFNPLDERVQRLFGDASSSKNQSVNVSDGLGNITTYTTESIVNAILTGDVAYMKKAKSQLASTQSPIVGARDVSEWDKLIQDTETVKDLLNERTILETLQSKPLKDRQAYINQVIAFKQDEATKSVGNMPEYASIKGREDENQLAKTLIAADMAERAWQNRHYNIFEGDKSELKDLGENSLAAYQTSKGTPIYKINEGTDKEHRISTLDRKDFSALMDDYKTKECDFIVNYDDTFGLVGSFIYKDSDKDVKIKLDAFENTKFKNSSIEKFKEAALNFTDYINGKTIPIMSVDDVDSRKFLPIGNNIYVAKAYDGNGDVLNLINVKDSNNNNHTFVTSAKDVAYNQGIFTNEQISNYILTILGKEIPVTKNPKWSLTVKKDQPFIYTVKY